LEYLNFYNSQLSPFCNKVINRVLVNIHTVEHILDIY